MVQKVKDGPKSKQIKVVFKAIFGLWSLVHDCDEMKMVSKTRWIGLFSKESSPTVIDIDSSSRKIDDISSAGRNYVSSAGYVHVSSAGRNHVSSAGRIDKPSAGRVDKPSAGRVNISPAGRVDISPAGRVDISSAGRVNITSPRGNDGSTPNWCGRWPEKDSIQFLNSIQNMRTKLLLFWYKSLERNSNWY